MVLGDAGSLKCVVGLVSTFESRFSRCWRSRRSGKRAQGGSPVSFGAGGEGQTHVDGAKSKVEAPANAGAGLVAEAGSGEEHSIQIFTG